MYAWRRHSPVRPAGISRIRRGRRWPPAVRAAGRVRARPAARTCGSAPHPGV